MICKMGKNKRNAFIIFVDEQKDKVPEWRKKSIKELVPLCEPLWEDLSSEKKKEYKKKRRQERCLTLYEERELESTGGQSTEQERWVILGGQVGGSLLYIKSLNYVLLYYSLSCVSIKQVF